MAWENPKTNWGQSGQTVPIADDFNRIEENIRILGEYNRAPGYGTATGTNAKTITLDPAPTNYYDGLCFAFKNVTQNTGAVTINVNGLGARPIKKPNGNDIAAGNLKANSVYTVRYNGTNFILQGEGGEYGTATASDVLSGKTIGTEEGLVTGTMPNRGAVNETLVSNNQEYTIPSGYHNGLGKIKAVISGLAASVIKAGTTVGGILGTFTSDANATDAQILSGRTAYVNGVKITGTIPSKSAQTYTPGTSNQTIASGQYLSGTQTILGSANLKPENIKEGVNIFGKVGSLKEMPSLDNYISVSGRRSGNYEIAGWFQQMSKGVHIINHTLFYISLNSGTISVDSSDTFLYSDITNVSTSNGFYPDFIEVASFNASSTKQFFIFNPRKVNLSINFSESSALNGIYPLID